MRAEYNTHNTVSADQMKQNQAQKWNRKLRFCFLSDNNNNKM